MDINPEFNFVNDSFRSKHDQSLAQTINTNLLHPSYHKRATRVSIDHGYDSFSSSYLSNLSQSTSFVPSLDTTVPSSTAASTANVDSSMLFYEPLTPVKSSPMYEATGSPSFQPSITPNKRLNTNLFSRNSYVADVDSIYYNSLRLSGRKKCPLTEEASPFPSSLTSSLSMASFSTASPFKSTANASNFTHFSASASNSPVTYTQSPKFVRSNGDEYLHERDSLVSKLLRSPAFRQQAPAELTQVSSHRPKISSFKSRFEFNSPMPPTPPPSASRRTTQMEDEFIDILIKNNHLPANPEFLIGRHVGLDSLDIFTELNKRNMFNVLESVLAHLTPIDLIHVGSVSVEWRAVVRQDRHAWRRRVEFVRERKSMFECSKENRRSPMLTVSDEQKEKTRRPPLVRAANFGGYEGLNESNDVSMTESVGELKLVPFGKVCHNRLANMHSFDVSRFAKATNFAQSSSSIGWHSMDGMASGNVSSERLYDELRTTGPKILGQLMSNLNSEAQKLKSMNEALPMIELSQKANSGVITRSKASRVLYQQQSWTGESVESKIASEFHVKHLKMSPGKASSPTKFSPSKQASGRIELIGSKKSKKNLKRL